MDQLLLEIAPDRNDSIVRIPNGVDVEELEKTSSLGSSKQFSPDKPFLLFLGGLNHKKGVDVLLKAVRCLMDGGKLNYSVVIAGDGAMRDELERLSKSLSLDKTVHFAGRVEGEVKRNLFQECRFVVMPSLTEGFGMVAIEAFACGKPLVASSVGGLKELMEGKPFLGLLSPPGDEQSLAHAISKMSQTLHSYDPVRIKNFASDFSWKNIAQEYLSLYQKCIKVRHV
jgi:glycosyltransferase involved in cell wall biosynthesis